MELRKMTVRAKFKLHFLSSQTSAGNILGLYATNHFGGGLYLDRVLKSVFTHELLKQHTEIQVWFIGRPSNWFLGHSTWQVKAEKCLSRC